MRTKNKGGSEMFQAMRPGEQRRYTRGDAVLTFLKLSSGKIAVTFTCSAARQHAMTPSEAAAWFAADDGHGPWSETFKLRN